MEFSLFDVAFYRSGMVEIENNRIFAQWLKITLRAKRASYVYILSGQKLIKNAKKWSILASF